MSHFDSLSRTFLLVFSVMVTSQDAFAEERVSTKGYVGIGSGQTSFGYDSEQRTRDIGVYCNVESGDNSLKIFDGISLGQNATVELTYYDFGSLEGTASGGVGFVGEQAAFSVAMPGLAPFNEQVGSLSRLASSVPALRPPSRGLVARPPCPIARAISSWALT